LSVICSVSLDHTAILGNTVEKIAEQKAGIIKRGSPAVLAPENPPSVVGIISRRAESCGSRLVIPDTDKLRVISCTAFGNAFEYRGERFETAMGGYHQIKNAMTVIEAAELLRGQGYAVTKAALDEGLQAQIPGRIQILSRKPLVIVDGGHNPDGVKALADALGTLDCKKRIVIGMLGDKDSDSAAEYIAKSAERFVCVDGFCPAARPRGELAELLRSHGANAFASDFSAEETVKRELETLEGDEALVISGSLYLAAEFAGKTI
jgi:dihydrofolate synthase/folylpolyglutamate synthase